MKDLAYHWPDGKKCAVILSFDFDGETPFLWRSRNQNVKTMGEFEQRRFGPRQGVHRILDLLAKWDSKASFFIPGRIAEQYPQAVEEIVKYGHEIGLHGYLHERVDELNEEEIEETLIQAKESLQKITGQRQMGYRSPSWEMTESAFNIIMRHQVLYDSSLMGYDHPYWIGGLPEIPVQWLLDDAIFYRYTGGSSASPPPINPKVVIDSWKQEFEGMKRFGGLFMVTMHPWISGRASRILALEELIKHLKKDTEVWWATCEEVAAYHRTAYPDQFRETIHHMR
ncbi:polysaccharide deacetylase [Fodinisporobacter ferrooxydans]|uniref:Polysaccharide deacetylase n=1 Tax=Fodinisporobacter ferrooxydans TaxID=2901836 RepID=A0ABY4CEQ3_9BACL|nr:polysaccharide deacetylase [Alicyclobacillaceae bacterium MYW30-H2]